MTKEQIIKVFDWLEKNANKDGLLNFILLSEKEIVGFFKENDMQFATFYIRPILEIIKENESK